MIKEYGMDDRACPLILIGKAKSGKKAGGVIK